MDPIQGIALARLAIGSVCCVSPRLAARLFLVDPESNPATPYFNRLFGVREVALGALTLTATGEERDRLALVGVAIDAADAFNGVSALASGSVDRKAALALTMVGAGAAATGATYFRAISD